MTNHVVHHDQSLSLHMDALNSYRKDPTDRIYHLNGDHQIMRMPVPTFLKHLKAFIILLVVPPTIVPLVVDINTKSFSSPHKKPIEYF